MTERRLLLALVVIVVVGFVAWMLWPYIVGLGVTLTAWRVIRRHDRRRRPKSSWSSLGRTGALMYAAWNSRWLKAGNRVTSFNVPAKLGADDDPARPF